MEYNDEGLLSLESSASLSSYCGNVTLFNSFGPNSCVSFLQRRGTMISLEAKPFIVHANSIFTIQTPFLQQCGS